MSWRAQVSDAIRLKPESVAPSARKFWGRAPPHARAPAGGTWAPAGTTARAGKTRRGPGRGSLLAGSVGTVEDSLRGTAPPPLP